MTRFSTIVLLSSLALGSSVVIAQQPTIAPPPAPMQSQQDWAPQGIEGLGQNAVTREDFTLSRQMLQFAQKFLDSSDEETRRVVAGLNGVTVHSYHFSDRGVYDPAAIESIRNQYRAAGWKHMVSKHGGVEQHVGVTDLWIRFNNAQITNLAVLLVGPRDLNFVAFSGVVRPLDLLHLSGHFGIPRFDTGAFEAAPDSRP
jgi:hypothetical protein